ncbi:hypothetical protein DTO166G4_351 [Paecilomyces variotii]|nr:hypothetical protein DTO164E3_7140 [Paecilomyces variotii]KAJ9217960.1 hypothetical protein DTO166G4_351 [Paecilomyces variotii]KAJ9226100.1 hypothetical protein DTO169C6_1739 [Paecilomyces variotii]KAJ9229674.1 hypothetical protein DTO166G5_7744 [Paecilomyces variotii]KAJ9266976.1 hypothetical protein DTO195F2_911 [Paecilomyces variotii]
MIVHTRADRFETVLQRDCADRVPRGTQRRVKTRIDPVSHSDLSSIEIAHNSSEIPYSETHVCGWDVTMDSFIRCEM